MSKKMIKTSEYTQANFFMIATGVILLLYIYLLVCLYPFLIEPGYAETSRVKYGFLIAVSFGFYVGPVLIPTFVPLSLLFIIIGNVIYVKNSGRRLDVFFRSLRFSVTDIMVALYAFFAIISAIVSPYKEDVLWGALTWYMGLASQFLFVFIYFITSRFFDIDELKGLVCLSLASSAVVFAIGILQRFGCDIFNLYAGLENKLYISTIGQHTHFSSYMIVFYILGVIVVWMSKPESVMHKIAIFHLIVASCLPCILNADMIFSGLFFALSFLFVMSFESIEKIKAFFKISLIIIFTWRFIGIVWNLLNPEFRLEPLPKFIMSSPYIWMLAVCLLIVYVLKCRKAGEKSRLNMIQYRYMGYLYAGILGFAIAITIVYIVLNTLEILPQSLRSHANYLLFDFEWGNGRGAIWHDSVMSFIEEFKTAPLNALFGVGPDQFVHVLDEYVHEWLVLYTDKIAYNAHNEWLNAFINYGLFGGIAYLGIFISAIVRFIKNREAAPAAFAVSVIIVAYLAHQMFGYQQFVSTPYIFMAIGIGEQAVRRNC
ncbi:MAG: O-antigen ligase family protein [Lachnospiraceae bacterium]|nr:O-antigen ligase family protein [Lachnospiraceae bacterium]